MDDKPLPVSVRTDCISNSVILSNDHISLLIALCMQVQVMKMALQMKLWLWNGGFHAPCNIRRCENIMGLFTAQCEMLLFCVETIANSLANLN